MFQNSLKKYTVNRKGKYLSPKLEICTVADIYTLYVLNAGIPYEEFWNQDILFLESVYFNKMTFNRWENNPKER